MCQGTIDSDNTGYSDSGFCNGTSVVGAYCRFRVTASAAGTDVLGVRFANGGSGAPGGPGH